MTAGLTAQGFQRKTYLEIKGEVEQAVVDALGEVNLQSDSVLGQLIAIICVPIAQQWEELQNVYDSQYAATAEGVSLDKAVDLVGVRRLEATRTRVIAALTGEQATAIPAGTQVRVVETGEVFTNPLPGVITRSNAVIIVCTPRTVADETEYSLVINGTAIVYETGIGATAESIVAGLVSAINDEDLPIVATDLTGGSFEVRTTQNDLAFNSVVSSNLTITSRTSPLLFESVTVGPVLILANTLTEIVTPLRGWLSVTNLEAGAQGRRRETDQELRLRRLQSFRVAGAGSVESIQARLRQNVASVSAAHVYENREPYEVDGRPPHSFESIVVGGLDSEIAQEIWDAKPAGIQTFGNTCVLIDDSNGDQQQICFSRPVEIYIWVKVEVDPISGLFPADGLTAITNAVLAFGQTFNVGEDILYQQFYGAIYTVQGIAGINLTLATSMDPDGPPGAYTAANVDINEAQVGIFDLNRISVTFE